MTDELLKKRAIDATVGDLADALLAKINLAIEEKEVVAPLPPLMRPEELAKMIGCSSGTIQNWGNDKRFKPAIKREGNITLIDTRKFLEIYGSPRGGRNY